MSREHVHVMESEPQYLSADHPLIKQARAMLATLIIELGPPPEGLEERKERCIDMTKLVTDKLGITDKACAICVMATAIICMCKKLSTLREVCPKCGLNTVVAKMEGGVICTNLKCDYWFCY